MGKSTVDELEQVGEKRNKIKKTFTIKKTDSFYPVTEVSLKLLHTDQRLDSRERMKLVTPLEMEQSGSLNLDQQNTCV